MAGEKKYTDEDVRQIMMRETTKALIAMWGNQVVREHLTMAGLMSVQTQLNARDSELVHGPGVNELRRRVDEALARAIPDSPEGIEGD